MFEPEYECTGEFIDGIWEGCGCSECRDAEADAVERAVETGDMTDQEARAWYRDNGYDIGEDNDDA